MHRAWNETMRGMSTKILSLALADSIQRESGEARLRILAEQVVG